MGVVNSTSVDDDLAEVYSSSKDELSDDACDSATEADAWVLSSTSFIFLWIFLFEIAEVLV